MLINTKDGIFLEIKVQEKTFLVHFDIYIFEGKFLTHQKIKKTIRKEKKGSINRSFTKSYFTSARNFFEEEPRRTHLRKGNNIFCFYDKRQRVFMNVRFDGHNILQDKETPCRLSSNKDIFFWMVTSITAGGWKQN